MSALLTRAPSVTNKIVEKELAAGQALSGEILKYCLFSVEESGYYSVSAQLCIRNASRRAIVADFLQQGVCDVAMEGYEREFISHVMNSSVEPAYVLSHKLSATMRLEAGKDYCCWVNFASDQNDAFIFVPECSHMRLYKL